MKPRFAEIRQSASFYLDIELKWNLARNTKGKKDTNAPRVWMILWKAARAVEQNALRSLNGLGLGLTDFAVLEILLNKGPLPVNTIGKKVLLTSGSITAAIDRLESKGLLTRTASPDDLRARIVKLTEPGRHLIEKAYARHACDMEKALSILKADERIELVRLLKKAGLWASSQLEGETPKPLNRIARRTTPAR